MFNYRILINITPEPRMNGARAGDRFVQTYAGSIHADDFEDAVWRIITRHNRDDRPDGQLGPSFSAGDVIAIQTSPNWVDQYWTSTGLNVIKIDWVPVDTITNRTWRQVQDEQRGAA